MNIPLGLTLALAPRRGDQSSLNLDFLQQRYSMGLSTKAFGDIISFSRASAATRINAAGLLETVAVNQPRFDYDPVTLQPKGLLIEEQRTNLCTYSEDFTNAAWAASSATKTTGVVDAFGSTKAVAVTVDTQNQSHFLLGPAGVAFIAGTTYTASVLVRQSGANRVQLSFPAAAFGATQYANFALSGSGSVLASNGLTAKIEPVANGFYRCQITAAASSTAAGNAFVVIFINADNAARLPVFVGNGSDGVTVCFGQTEAGAFATSYIPATSAQVTRAADVVTINTLSPWFSAGNGVLYAEHTTFQPAPAAQRVIELSNGGSKERIYIAQQSATTMRLNSSAAGATVVALTQSSPGLGFVTKTASRIKTNDFGISTNGLDSITDTDAPAPAGLNVIRLGSANFDLAFLNGHIRKMRYYPKNASNAELKTMTS